MTRRAQALALTAALTALVVVPVGALPQTRDAGWKPNREPALAHVPDSLFHHQRRCFWRDRAAVPGRGDARVQHLARGRQHPDVIDVCRLRAGAAVCRRWRQRDWLSQSAGPGSNARRDDVHGGYDRWTHSRVGHLLQHDLSVVDRQTAARPIAMTSNRSRCTRSATSSACRIPRSERRSSSVLLAG